MSPSIREHLRELKISKLVKRYEREYDRMLESIRGIEDISEELRGFGIDYIKLSNGIIVNILGRKEEFKVKDGNIGTNSPSQLKATGSTEAEG